MVAALTRRQHLVGLLAGREALTARDLAARLGWRPASVRAEISRLKTQGIPIAAVESRPRRYCLLSPRSDPIGRTATPDITCSPASLDHTLKSLGLIP